MQQNGTTSRKSKEGGRDGRAGGEGNGSGSDSPERRDVKQAQTNAGPMQKSEKKTLGLGSRGTEQLTRGGQSLLGRGWQKL